MRQYVNGKLFSILLGLIDGIFTMLTLTTGHILKQKTSLPVTVSLHVAIVTALSGSAVYFISEYSRLRQRLIKAEKELNFTKHGKFATTQLGRKVLVEASGGAIISCLFSFMGAAIPLVINIILPQFPWVSVISALIMLGILGALIARLIFGNVGWWILSLIIAGIMVTYIGYKLHVL